MRKPDSRQHTISQPRRTRERSIYELRMRFHLSALLLCELRLYEASPSALLGLTDEAQDIRHLAHDKVLDEPHEATQVRIKCSYSMRSKLTPLDWQFSDVLQGN